MNVPRHLSHINFKHTLMTRQKLALTVLAVLCCSRFYAQPSLSEWKEASEQHPVDITSLVTNASGTESDRVWLRHSADAAAGYNKNNTDFASAAYSGAGIESWYWTPQKNADLIWQDLNVLPGTYRVTAFVTAQVYNDAGRKGQNVGTVCLRIGDGMTAYTNNKWEKVVATGNIRGGTPLRIGIYAGDDNANDWVSIAQVKVECLGVNAEATEKIALNENYDVCALRELMYADLSLEKYLPAGQWTTLSLPCDLDEDKVKSLFAKVLTPGKITINKEEATLEATPVSTMQAGKPYLVQPLSTMEKLSFPGVMGVPESQSTAVEGWIPTYRLREGLVSCYTLDTVDGNPVLRPVGTNEPVKGFGAYLNTGSMPNPTSSPLPLTIVEH